MSAISSSSSDWEEVRLGLGLVLGVGVVVVGVCLVLGGVAPPVRAVSLEASAALVVVLLLPDTPKLLPGFALPFAPYRRVERTTNEQNLMMN